MNYILTLKWSSKVAIWMSLPWRSRTSYLQTGTSTASSLREWHIGFHRFSFHLLCQTGHLRNTGNTCKHQQQHTVRCSRPQYPGRWLHGLHGFYGFWKARLQRVVSIIWLEEEVKGFKEMNHANTYATTHTHHRMVFTTTAHSQWWLHGLHVSWFWFGLCCLMTPGLNKDIRTVLV